MWEIFQLKLQKKNLKRLFRLFKLMGYNFLEKGLGIILFGGYFLTGLIMEIKDFQRFTIS
jgi:hypothetical protein